MEERGVRIWTESDREDRDVVRLRPGGLESGLSIAAGLGRATRVLTVRQENDDPCMAPDSIRDELVIRDEERRAEVRAVARADRVEVSLGSAVIRDTVVVWGEEMVRWAANIGPGEPGDPVEVDTRYPVGAGETPNVVLRGADS